MIIFEYLSVFYVFAFWQDIQNWGDESMETDKMERVEIELPRDIIFAMRGLQKPEEVKKKLKIALAILLFRERAISLGKATELTGMSRVRFIDVLKEHSIPAYEYGDEDFEKDRQMIAEYRELSKNESFWGRGR